MKRLTLFVLFGLLYIVGHSQAWKVRRYEIWGGVSAIEYFGDIGGTDAKNNLFGFRDISILSIRPGINFGGNYRVKERIYINLNNTLGIITQTDKGSRNYLRDFAFNTIMDEFSLQGVYFILKENRNYNYLNIRLRGGSKNVKRIFSVYTFAGIGGLYFKVKPKASLINSSQFVDNKSLTLTLPVGLGLKVAYSSDLSYSIEFGGRYVLSDYIDGVSTQSSKHNDLYYILNFKASYRISTGKGVKRFFRNDMGSKR